MRDLFIDDAGELAVPARVDFGAAYLRATGGVRQARSDLGAQLSLCKEAVGTWHWSPDPRRATPDGLLWSAEVAIIVSAMKAGSKEHVIALSTGWHFKESEAYARAFCEALDHLAPDLSVRALAVNAPWATAPFEERMKRIQERLETRVSSSAQPEVATPEGHTVIGWDLAVPASESTGGGEG